MLYKNNISTTITLNANYLQYLFQMIIEIIPLLIQSNASFESLTYSPFSIHKTSVKAEHDLDDTDTNFFLYIVSLNKQTWDTEW